MLFEIITSPFHLRFRLSFLVNCFLRLRSSAINAVKDHSSQFAVVPVTKANVVHLSFNSILSNSSPGVAFVEHSCRTTSEERIECQYNWPVSANVGIC